MYRTQMDSTNHMALLALQGTVRDQMARIKGKLENAKKRKNSFD